MEHILAGVSSKAFPALLQVGAPPLTPRPAFHLGLGESARLCLPRPSSGAGPRITAGSEDR